ncbi:hypothetical protein JCM14076_21020 [Methylosoma difficile]
MKTNCTRLVLKEFGFSYLELLVTLAIAAILAGSALPNLNDLIRSGRLTEQTNNIVDALMTARNKSVTTHYNAIVAPVSSWTGDIRVFLDKNGNNSFNDGIDEVIQKYQASASGEMSISSTAQQFVFTSDGRALTSGDVNISNRGNNAKKITVSPTGRLKTETVQNTTNY